VYKRQGEGGFDVPTGNFDNSCGTIGSDLCSINHALGLTYGPKDGISFTVFGTINSGATPARLIQDVVPVDSGIAVLSEADPLQDQTSFASGEWIDFLFNTVVTLFNIEFNAGDDTNCSFFGPEGPCGDFELVVDNVSRGVITAVDLLAAGGPTWTGTRFSFRPVSGGGFAIAQFTVNQVPVPGALPLLLAGLAGLGFAARRKRTV
jgi:hypothetical protein